MKLWYVRADTGEGDDLSLLVKADTKLQAHSAWMSYYNIPENHSEVIADWIGEVPLGIDLPGPAGPVGWDTINPD